MHMEDNCCTVLFLSVRWRLRKRGRSLRHQPSIRVTCESYMSGVDQVAGSPCSSWSYKTWCASHGSSRKCELFKLEVVFPTSVALVSAIGSAVIRMHFAVHNDWSDPQYSVPEPHQEIIQIYLHHRSPLYTILMLTCPFFLFIICI